MRIEKLPLAVTLGVGALAVAASLMALRREPTASPRLPAFMEDRAGAIAAELAQVRGPYVLLIGDSHAERLFLPTLCGVPVINAGFSGARMDEIAQVAAGLGFPEPARAIVVIAGTNDLQRLRRPEAHPAAFRHALGRLLDILRPHAARVVAVPIPPLDTTRAAVVRDFAVELAPRYGAIVAQECARRGCVLAEPLGPPPTDRAASDGVHQPIAALVAPGGARDRLERAACGRADRGQRPLAASSNSG